MDFQPQATPLNRELDLISKIVSRFKIVRRVTKFTKIDTSTFDYLFLSFNIQSPLFYSVQGLLL